MTQADHAADRQDAILNAAFHAFASYGFRRTTMDDIASGTGISRSALYLHFRNKEDIFRSLAQRYFTEAEQAMAGALGQPGVAPAEALLAAFQAKDGKFMDVVLGTPHGRELLDVGFSVSADIAAVGEARMEALLAGWIGRFRLAPGLGSAVDLAATVQSALKGLKLSATSGAAYRDGQARLARLVALALQGP